MQSRVDISGLPKAQVLLKLYDNAICAGKEFHGRSLITCSIRLTSKPGKIERAETLLKENDFDFNYIELVDEDPRPLKVNLCTESFDPSTYDAYHGYPGYARTLIHQLRDALYPEKKHVSEQEETTFTMFHVLNDRSIQKSMASFEAALRTAAEADTDTESSSDQQSDSSDSVSLESDTQTFKKQWATKGEKAKIGLFGTNRKTVPVIENEEPEFGPLRTGYRFPSK